MKKIIQTIFLLILLIGIIAQSKVMKVNHVLKSDAIEIPFVKADNRVKNILDYDQHFYFEWQPQENEIIDNNSKNFWKKTITEEINIPSKKKEFIKYYSFYITTSKYLSGKLNIESHYPLAIYLNGNKKATKTSVSANNKKTAGKLSIECELETGKHLVIIKSLYTPESNKEWDVKIDFEVDENDQKELFFSLTSQRFLELRDILENKKVTKVFLSYNGDYSAINYSQKKNSSSDFEIWTEIYNNEKLIYSSKSKMPFSNIKWSLIKNEFLFVSSNKNNQSLYLFNVESKEITLIKEDIKNFIDYEWINESNSIIYTVVNEEKKTKSDINFINSIEERIPNSSLDYDIYLLDVKTKYSTILVKNVKNLSLQSVNNYGFLFTTTAPNIQSPSYFTTMLYHFDLNNYDLKEIIKENYSFQANISADSKYIIILGSPAMFNNVGKVTDKIANNYDTQAFIYNIESKKVIPISKNFNPSITNVYWKNNNLLYFLVNEEDYKSLFEYSIKENQFKKIETGFEVIEDIDFDSKKEKSIMKGCSAIENSKIKLIDFSTQKTFFTKEVDDNKQNIIKSKLDEFTFVPSSKNKIKGRVYYPPNFDKTKKYPMIVNYYAGVNPMTRYFEGRYPANYWAANGYIVFVLTTSGAVGFGQEYSSQHVNDWGEITSNEIIESVESLIKNNNNIDKNKIGCIGASYGGFETMSLISKTNIFSAAISHAGISNITSYWGSGYWGYTYSATASTKSYPWNNQQLYINKSPLFSADKINTSLLLIHGDSDTNVPVTESYQMYIALQILNKDVNLVTVKDADHQIMDYSKRLDWSKVILAYFDKYLKNQSSLWNSIKK